MSIIVTLVSYYLMTIDARLADVVSAVFAVDSSLVSADASPKTIAAWDSVGHLQFMLAIEAEFGIEIAADAIADLTNVGAIRRHLERTMGSGD